MGAQVQDLWAGSYDHGTATAVGATTLTDAHKNWPVNGLVGFIKVRVDNGIDQMRVIVSNTANAITVAAWNTDDPPQVGAQYVLVGSSVSDSNSAAILAAVGQSTATPTSVLYVGNGTTGNELQESQTTSALLNVADHVAAVIAVGAKNLLDIQIVNATAAEAMTLVVREYSTAVPTRATAIRSRNIAWGATDNGRTVDRAAVGLATGTDYYVKAPVTIDVLPGSFVTLCLVENITGLAYARYTLRAAV